MGLDLSTLEGWTHELLQEVARRRGIRNPEFRSHGELVRLLLRQQYGERVQAGRERVARGVAGATLLRRAVGQLVGTAIEQLLPHALGTLLAPPSAPPPQAKSIPAAADGGEAHIEPSVPAASPAGHTREPATRQFVETPRRTRAMARVLAEQGHRERALSIYRELLAAGGGADAGLRDEMDRIAQGRALPGRHVTVSSGGPQRAVSLQSSDRLTCDLVPGRGLRLQWSVSAAGLQRGRAVLAEPGELAVRLVNIERDPQAVVRSAIMEHGPLEPSGDWTAPLVTGERCLVAVGLRAGDRFVSIVHATAR